MAGCEPVDEGERCVGLAANQHKVLIEQRHLGGHICERHMFKIHKFSQQFPVPKITCEVCHTSTREPRRPVILSQSSKMHANRGLWWPCC